MFFSIEPQICNCEQKCSGDLPYKWTYKNGVFPGNFESVLGKGGEGVVIQGRWHGKDAAFKFTPVKHTKKDRPNEKFKMSYFESLYQELYVKKVQLEDALPVALAKASNAAPREDCREDSQKFAQENLQKNLNEIFKMQSTMGSAIVKPYGHYRYLMLLKPVSISLIQTATCF